MFKMPLFYKTHVFTIYVYVSVYVCAYMYSKLCVKVCVLYTSPSFSLNIYLKQGLFLNLELNFSQVQKQASPE